MSDAVKGLRQKEKHCSTFYFQDHQVGHVGREPPVKPTVAKQFHISTWQMSLKEETERNCFIFNLSCSHPPSQHFKKKKKNWEFPHDQGPIQPLVTAPWCIHEGLRIGLGYSSKDIPRWLGQEHRRIVCDSIMSHDNWHQKMEKCPPAYGVTSFSVRCASVW